TGLSDFPEGYYGDYQRPPNFYTATWTSTLSATTLNEFRFGMKNDDQFLTSPFNLGCCVGGKSEDDLDPKSKEAIASYPQFGTPTRVFYTFPGMGLGLYAQISRVGGAPRFNKSMLLQFADTLSWIKGAHAFQGGFDVTRTGSSQNTTGGIANAYPFATLGVGNIPIPGINATNFRGLQSNDVTTAENLLANLAGTIVDISQKFYTNSPKETEFSDY